MYYRRKIILALLQALGGRLDKISLQKLLFLLVRNQDKKSFHFVPYKYGCFSFQANADLNTLTKYNFVTSSMKYWQKNDEHDYIGELNVKDKAAVRDIKNQYGSLDKDELIAITYKNYPYFAIHSKIANSFLSKEELNKIKERKPAKNNITLFTIGYEGITLEQYINKLIIYDVKVLCDVRKKPMSMKYGFNKKQLTNACNGVGMEYIHIPEVGIESNKRQDLKTQADYDKLFESYKTDVLSKEIKKQEEILLLLESKERVALTCFEANIHQCHRKYLAESISGMERFTYEIKHI
jgi:uncharacterized protein (DUF488 family)